MTLRSYFRLLAEDRPHVGPWAPFWKPILKVASFVYFLGLQIHRLLYHTGILKQHTLSRPVISVGNVTWGGTGKTPIVEYVARFYLNRRKTPLILARGYGQDESKLLARQLPEAQFGIGKDRLRAAEQVLARRPADVIILDDGFQHWPIKRDLDIAVINVLNPFGNLSLVPRGILREPLKGLRRAAIVVLTDVNLTPRKELEALKVRIRDFSPKVEFIEAYREALFFYRPGSRERLAVNRLEGERVTSFSGIGTPRSFLMLLNLLGIKTVRNFEFTDHHSFTEKELNEILRVKELSESKEVITTEKDYLRCEEPVRRIVKPLVLKSRLRLTTGEGLLHQFLGHFAGSSLSQAYSSGEGESGKPSFNSGRKFHRRRRDFSSRGSASREKTILQDVARQDPLKETEVKKGVNEAGRAKNDMPPEALGRETPNV
ncbi:MAG: tetraacyldisaccharide 4'-kinase [Candidatus Omnitrophica bacterium]|nr:tetraacyldisaccharide 4'-kinase [Candidatus Omnitrophota bacterium]